MGFGSLVGVHYVITFSRGGFPVRRSILAKAEACLGFKDTRYAFKNRGTRNKLRYYKHKNNGEKE